MPDPTPPTGGIYRERYHRGIRRPAQNAPADPPHAAHTPPADGGPHPDTPPHAHGILGRALLSSGRLWLHDGGWWARWPREQWRRDEVADHYGEPREVLLVDPAAWQQRERVIQAACAVARCQSRGHPEWHRVLTEQRAAVDALTGGPDNRTNQDSSESLASSNSGPDHDVLAGQPLAPLAEWERELLERQEQAARREAETPTEPAVIKIADGFYWVGQAAAEAPEPTSDPPDGRTCPCPRGGWHPLCAIHQDRDPELLAALAAYRAAQAPVPEPPHAAEGYWWCDGCGDHFGPADVADGDVEPWCAMCRKAGRADAPEPAGETCVRCGQPIDPSLTAVYGGPDSPRHGTCPEPAGDGPGWDRPSINGWIDFLLNGPEETRDPESADQLTALLGRHDRLERERDTLLAAFDKTLTDMEQETNRVVTAEQQRDTARAERDQLERERDEARADRDTERANADCWLKGAVAAEGHKMDLDEAGEQIAGLRNVLAVRTAERDKALRLVALRDDEWNAHEGELGDMRAELSAAEVEIDELRELTATCGCGDGNPETYEGPQPDCPVHGAVRAFNEASRELAELREQLEHARADRQDLWDTRDKRNHRWMEAAERYQTERDAARAELAEVTADRDRLTREWAAADATAQDYGTRLDECAAELAETQSERDQSDAALQRAAADMAQMQIERDRYREHSILLNSVQWKLAEVLGEVPDGAEQIQHDPNRVSRLAELVASLRAELATARRDTAAATLEEAAERGAGLLTSPYFEHVAANLRQWAAEIRTGQRDTPGSPEPAHTEKGDDDA